MPPRLADPALLAPSRPPRAVTPSLPLPLLPADDRPLPVVPVHLAPCSARLDAEHMWTLGMQKYPSRNLTDTDIDTRTCSTFLIYAVP